MTTPLAYSLNAAPLAVPHHVTGVQAPHHAPEWLRWLEDLGFVQGECVQVLSRAQPGDDPMVVRIGASTFALRAAEAACIRVSPVAADRG